MRCDSTQGRARAPGSVGPSACVFLVGCLVSACNGVPAPLDGAVADASDDAARDVAPAVKQPAMRTGPGGRPPPVASGPTFGAPLPGLTAAQLDEFADGLEEFSKQETVEGGLGPLYNNTGCFVCHGVPATGGSTNLFVTRFGRTANGVFDPMDGAGGSLLQQSAIDRLAREFLPATANVTARRQSTPLFGLGLVEAIEDTTILAVAASEPAAVRGTVSMVRDAVSGTMRVGRFGWKCQVATLLDFSGDAYVNEMGITNRFYPRENAPNGDALRLAASDTVADPEDQIDPATGKSDIDYAADFMRYLAPPPRMPFNPPELAGEMHFMAAGCADCHTPVMNSGPSPVASLARRPVALYSDLLLHDMGALGDGIAQGAASPTQMRTTPLWGLRVSAPYLHDGRANTIADAITAHAGQGAAARDRFQALTPAQRDELLAFLRAL